MFAILEKIEKAEQSKSKVTLIDKMGRYYHGVVEESNTRISGTKMRGRVVFSSVEKGQFEIDIADILDILQGSSL